MRLVRRSVRRAIPNEGELSQPQPAATEESESEEGAQSHAVPHSHPGHSGTLAPLAAWHLGSWVARLVGSANMAHLLQSPHVIDSLLAVAVSQSVQCEGGPPPAAAVGPRQCGRVNVAPLRQEKRASFASHESAAAAVVVAAQTHKDRAQR